MLSWARIGFLWAASNSHTNLHTSTSNTRACGSKVFRLTQGFICSPSDQIIHWHKRCTDGQKNERKSVSLKGETNGVVNECIWERFDIVDHGVCMSLIFPVWDTGPASELGSKSLIPLSVTVFFSLPNTNTDISTFSSPNKPTLCTFTHRKKNNVLVLDRAGKIQTTKSGFYCMI